MSPPKNIVWHASDTTHEERCRLLGQKGCVIWLTGLSGSGKSTIAHALERKLLERRRFAYVLDGDNVRHGLNANLGFSETDRNENVRRITEVARLFADAGVICITAFISPFRAAREQSRRVIGHERYVEIHVSTDIRVCESRDVKGLYRKARAGEIPDFTGVSSPYEEPESPDLRLDTSTCSIEESIDRILNTLEKRGLFTESSPA